MAAKRKTWQEKLADKPGYPKVIALQAGFPCYNAVHDGRGSRRSGDAG